MQLAFSYLRFSSPEQAKGDSIRRQMEAAAEWCHRNGVTLDTALTLRDEGVSAFKGKNRENADIHGMACFLQAVKSGRVPKGSALLLENLDRLTRESIVPAVNLFTGILIAGVKIVQLRPSEHVFTEKADMSSVMLAIVELSRGNSESAMKSDRGGKAWANKKKNARQRIVTRRLPVWIKCEKDKLVLDPAKAKTVRRMFASAREGSSLTDIARAFNVEKVPLPGRKMVASPGQAGMRKEEKKRLPVKWSASLVYRILTSRATIGEYQPHKGRPGDRKPDGPPIPDYYPPVVSQSDFDLAQRALKQRAAVGRGRRGKRIHLFAGLLKEARTGGSLICRHHNTRESVIFPAGAAHGRGDKWVSFPLRAFEKAVRSELVEVKIEDLEATTDAKKKIEAMSSRQSELENLIKRWKGKMDQPELVDVVAEKLAVFEKERRKIAEALAQAHAESSSPLSEALGHLRTVGKAIDDDDSDENRVRCRAAIRRAVEAVHCLFMPPAGCRLRLAGVQVRFRNGATRNYLIVHRPAGFNRYSRWPMHTVVKSFAELAITDTVDLREPADVAALEKQLARIDPRLMLPAATAGKESAK